ncbi:DUF433 domain-containing protein [Nitrolancea hollandica]|uniref:Antitoxin n=1 Tax=Nitrolancea hollandica Lb TaxID=1129897 RepID=I4EHN7_9BACT|nr:DUF433 domain-containing protein [Nitrolancea hollandica]CCF84199.1 hypothetical protein NITHO_3210007 [Nitrolancea hollandica Lb]
MENEQQSYKDRITANPDVMVGKPVVRGTRIPVEVVLAKLAQNPNVDELFADYPRLTLEDVKACLAYARVLVEKEEKGRKRHLTAY